MTMTHYHLYIKAGVQLDADTRFYKVTIGEGKKGHRQSAWLEAYAIEHGHFFVRWSTDAVDFYSKCQECIGKDAFPILALSGHDLIKTLKNGCDDPACWSAIQHRHELLMQIDPHYYTYHELVRR